MSRFKSGPVLAPITSLMQSSSLPSVWDREILNDKLTPHWTRPPPIYEELHGNRLCHQERIDLPPPHVAHICPVPQLHTHTHTHVCESPQLPECVFEGQNKHTSPRHTPLSLSLSLSILSSVARRDESQSRLCSFRTDTGSRRHNSQ